MKEPSIVEPPVKSEQSSEPCLRCNGQTWIRLANKPTETCPRCDGTGEEPNG